MWSVKSGNFVEVVSDDGIDAPICTVHNRGKVSGDHEGMLKTAHLLSAAEDMLKALEQITKLVVDEFELASCSPGEQEIYDRCFAAIAKAHNSKATAEKGA